MHDLLLHVRGNIFDIECDVTVYGLHGNTFDTAGAVTIHANNVNIERVMETYNSAYNYILFMKPNCRAYVLRWGGGGQHSISRCYIGDIQLAPVTPGLRPGYDLPATEKWANRRKNVRLVAEVVRLVAEVVGDRKGQISRNKVDGHVQNWSCHLTTGGTTNRLLTQNVTIDLTIDLGGDD